MSMDIDGTEPAAEPWMWVVPSNHILWSIRLFQHFQHLGLEDLVHSLDGDSGSALRHGEDVHNFGGVFVWKLMGLWLLGILERDYFVIEKWFEMI